jgi:hypothetical protein
MRRPLLLAAALRTGCFFASQIISHIGEHCPERDGNGCRHEPLVARHALAD